MITARTLEAQVLLYTHCCGRVCVLLTEFGGTFFPPALGVEADSLHPTVKRGTGTELETELLRKR